MADDRETHPTSRSPSARLDSLEDRLNEMWRRSDAIFHTVRAEGMHHQPISLRHPVVFYLGHLPAFAWNQICRGVLGRPSPQPEFDELFERGIDPTGVDHYESQERWPSISEIIDYRDRVRQAVLDAIPDVRARAGSRVLATNDRIFEVVIEHELMHQETLQYMFLHLPTDVKCRPQDLPPLVFEGAAPQQHARVEGGPVALGADFDEIPFGWDNEFPACRTEVDDFIMDRTPVRVSEYLEFLADGGYERPELWTDTDWAWRSRLDIRGPSLWSLRDGRWFYETMFDSIDVERASDWPVFVSLAEARAYCRWAGARLPTEAEFHRAAYTTPDREPREHPWGSDPPGPKHGNFDFKMWAPSPVGAFPDGNSAWGISDLVGNGWQWTDTPFAPFPGFEAYISTYPGYSTDFFDDRHFVMLGASWATPKGLIRRSFRNWFQDHYPYVFAGFRCVRAP